ncbi:MAG: FIST C-terminal domain-containing protein [Sulfuricella sp.]|nr:FIST C-terminal domain-containing protein [Sulfuricella sp.]
MTIATGLATAPIAEAHLAAEAVNAAMEKAGLTVANSVLLFLTPEFARDPKPALLAASRASNCTRIIGCTAAGIFTEQDWVLDAPAAAAMVFGGVGLAPANHARANDLILSLAAPNAINSAWINEPGRRFGAISGDATGQGPFKVWCGGRISENGRCETLLSGATGSIGISQGIRPLSDPIEITQASGYDIVTIGRQPALNVLARDLPYDLRAEDNLPLHLLMVGIIDGDPATAIDEGRFRLSPIISTNPNDRSVTLSAQLAAGERMFWAVRQPLAAERDMRLTLDRLEKDLGSEPDFGLLFPCMGRGPYFYGGVDRDLDLVRRRFPSLPLIGFYGNGEIGPLNGANQLLQYAAVLGLFHATDV